MKKAVLFCLILAVLVSGCGGGSSGPSNIDNTIITGDWSYVIMMGGSFITARGTSSFQGDGTATYTEDAISTGSTQPDGNFNYTAYSDNRIVFEQWIGNLSSDGNFFVATDTDDSVADPGVMFMVAVKQPTGADNTLLTDAFFTGVFSNTADGTSSITVINESIMNGAIPGSITVDEIIAPVPDPNPGIILGYDVAADGLTTLYDAPGGTATGQTGIVSIDGNLFINADATASATNPMLSMSVKGSAGKTNASLAGTYVLHTFADNITGTGSFVTTRAEITFNGDDNVGVGTGTFTETAKSNFDAATNPLGTGPFTYIVDTTALGNPATFLIDDASGDPIYGVMSPDTNVLGVVNVDPDGPADATLDDSVFLGVAVKK